MRDLRKCPNTAQGSLSWQMDRPFRWPRASRTERKAAVWQPGPGRAGTPQGGPARGAGEAWGSQAGWRGGQDPLSEMLPLCCCLQPFRDQDTLVGIYSHLEPSRNPPALCPSPLHSAGETGTKLIPWLCSKQQQFRGRVPFRKRIPSYCAAST